LLAPCSSKDYLQKQRRGREEAKSKKQKIKAQLKNYKLQTLQNKAKTPKLE
jgi:hypothetical protein